MSLARQIMHANATCVSEQEAVSTAAERMREMGIGALPICGGDGQLHGMLTDRDVAVKCVAAGLDPTATLVGQFAQGSAYTVDADASIAEVLNVMEEHQVRRLPVLDGGCLVGIISEADIARNLPEHAVAQFVKAICSPAALSTW